MSFLSKKEVSSLNKEHGYFEYADAQGDVSLAFANDAVDKFINMGVMASEVQDKLGLNPYEMEDEIKDMLSVLEAIKDICNESNAERDYTSKLTEIRGMSMHFVKKYERLL